MFNVANYGKNIYEICRFKFYILIFMFKYFAVFWWGQIEADPQYAGKLCGLCGNFDGNPNDLMLDGMIS